jgi:glyoxylase-like metal-dependent hydrolase (beta-lactamase superfamily II)
VLYRNYLVADTVNVGGCGRTDFQGGDAGLLCDSVVGRVFMLPDDILVYPAYDCPGRCASTMG